MHLVCRCSLPVWRRSFLKKGTPVTYFGPTLDPPLGGSGRKTTTHVRDHEYFIPTKFHQNPSSGFGEEVENVKSLRTTTTDGRTDDGRCAMTIAHSSLRLRWAKKRRGRKIINHYIPEGTRESHPRVHDLRHPRLCKPRHGLQIVDTRMGFPCPFRSVVIDSISLGHISLFFFI